jgi:hypothetical protein
MIQSFTVTNHTGQSMMCELANPWKEGLAVASIDGLGPGQATVNVADISSMDGGLFNSARKGTRNIVLNLIFVDHDTLTIEDIRRKCYTYFPLKKKVKLKITTSDGKAFKDFYIDGYVESNEPAIFSSQEGASISLLCPQPYFYKSLENEQRFSSSSNPEFSFEFSKIPSDNSELLMGDIVSYIVTNIYYEGDADTGVVVEIVFKSDVSHDPENPKTIRIDNSLTNTANEFSLEKIKTIVSAQLDEYTGIVSGDKIVLSTVKGEKNLTYIHNNVEYNVIGAMSPMSSSGEWLYLTAGSNYLAINKDASIEIIASVKNKTYYYGV